MLALIKIITMTFGINMNHIIDGVKLGYSYPNPITITPPAKPLIYNVVDAASIVTLLNIMLLPKPKLFVGTMKFSTTPVDDSRSMQLQDPLNQISFYYTDSIAINNRAEKFITMPIIFSKIECTLGAKYSLCLFGYLLEYNF